MGPVIGLTTQYEYLVNRKLIQVNNTYVDAIIESGGTPIVLPIVTDEDKIDNYLDLVDGLIFTGGGDISPLYFGEEPIKEIGSICLDRDKMELELFKRAYERGIPVFGICRGLQLINVALKGTIYQDIFVQLPYSIAHVCGDVHQGFHTINILKDSILYKAFGKEKLVVNSQHHQSIKDVGDNLRVTSTTVDGIIESIESTNDKFVLGVQFHPESMIYNDREFIKIFNYFIDRCK